MSISLRNQRAKIYAYTDAGSGGVVNSLYAFVSEAWARIDETSGQEITLGDGAEHHIDAKIAFSSEINIPQDSIIRYGDSYYKTLVVVPRRATREIVVSAVRCDSDEFSIEETGSIQTYTKEPFVVDLEASNAISASYATVAQTLLGSVESASYALTSSYASTAESLLGSVVSSSYAVTASHALTAVTAVTSQTSTSSSYATSASLASNAQAVPYSGVTGKPSLVSSSAQVNSGSFTGSFIGLATNATSSSYADSVQFANVSGKPTLVSSSAQVNSGSFTGSFVGSATNAVSSSFATTALSSNTTTSASYALTASYALNGGGSPGVSNTGSFTGSFTGSLLGTASFVVTASYALTSAGSVINAETASYVTYTNVADKPTLVSASAQINTGSFTGSFKGDFDGIGTNVTGVVSSSYAVTASYASNAGAGSSAWDDITGKPTGLVSASAQINTGSFTGSFTGSLLGGASTATTASHADSISSVDWTKIANEPAGLVSSSVQINTGSFTGSFDGEFTGIGSGLTGITSSSYAVTSSYASIAQTLLGLIESASYALTASYALAGGSGGAPSESSSYATTASYAISNRSQMTVAFSGSGATIIQHYPLSLNQWSFATTTSTSPSTDYIYIYPFVAPTNGGQYFKLKSIKVYHTTTMTDRHGSFAVYSNRQTLLQPDLLLYSSSATPLPTGDTEVTADLTLESGKVYWIAFHRNIGGAIQVASGNNSVNTLYGSATANPGTYISAMRSASSWGESGSYAPAWPSTVDWAEFGSQTSSTHAINIAGSFAVIE